MEDKLSFLKEIMIALLSKVDFLPEVVVSEKDGDFTVQLNGENLGILIGYHGETLLSIQTWLSMAFYQKYGEWQEVNLDIAGYAAERAVRLKEIAVNAADRARFLDKPVELSPMPAFERRLIHTFISELPGVRSESTGEGFERRVVVSVDKG